MAPPSESKLLRHFRAQEACKAAQMNCLLVFTSWWESKLRCARTDSRREAAEPTPIEISRDSPRASLGSSQEINGLTGGQGQSRDDEALTDRGLASCRRRLGVDVLTYLQRGALRPPVSLLARLSSEAALTSQCGIHTPAVRRSKLPRAPQKFGDIKTKSALCDFKFHACSRLAEPIIC